MLVTPIKTRKITSKDKDILAILDKYINKLKEDSIVAISSKIVSTTEGRAVGMETVGKEKLIKQEAELYLPREMSKYDYSIIIKNNTFIGSAGIDESNGDGNYILWPRNPQKSVNQIRDFLKKKFKLKNLGAIITDSKMTPLRWGVTGFALSHSGFKAIKSYIDKPDVFGRKLEVEEVNISDSLAASAVLVMGEGDEQTPMAIIENAKFVDFQDRNPTSQELKKLRIEIKDDIFAPIINSVKWKKGKG